MTKQEAIDKKDWKTLSLITAKEIKIKHRVELKRSDDQFFRYAVAKAKKQKKIRMGG